jgi:DNA invertase Pin-like site-specific DNA recombinase
MSTTLAAAVYARKSTEQNGVAEDDKSVARQIEHAKAYAAKKGWIVVEEHIYRMTALAERSSLGDRTSSA